MDRIFYICDCFCVRGFVVDSFLSCVEEKLMTNGSTRESLRIVFPTIPHNEKFVFKTAQRMTKKREGVQIRVSCCIDIL